MRGTGSVAASAASQATVPSWQSSDNPGSRPAGPVARGGFSGGIVQFPARRQGAGRAVPVGWREGELRPVLRHGSLLLSVQRVQGRSSRARGLMSAVSVVVENVLSQPGLRFGGGRCVRHRSSMVKRDLRMVRNIVDPTPELLVQGSNISRVS